MLLDTLLHKLVKLGPEGALTGALAALDIALWDMKGKLTGQPIYKLIGGAWRTALPFYASIGGNGDRALDDVLRVVEARLADRPAAVKIRFDNDRTRLDADIPGRHRQGARGAQAGRRRLAAGVRCQQWLHDRGRDPRRPRAGGTGYWWFEEPVQHYHVKAMGEVARALDITVSAGEQTYTLPRWPT